MSKSLPIMAVDQARLSNLNKLFNNVVRGNTPLTKFNYPLFLESICAQPVPPACVSKLMESQPGRSSLQAILWHDPSPTFCNVQVPKLFRYLSSPDLITIRNGALLKDISQTMVEPPIFWYPFVAALEGGELNEDGKLAFAQLLYNLISLLSIEEGEAFRKIASDPKKMANLFNSRSQDVRNLAQKIKHGLAVFEQGGTSDDVEAGPGGRHDNDFADFRKISIVPTADEIGSTKGAFFRKSDMFDDDANKDSRQSIYYDNQFRLLREDMLYEIRDEMAINKQRKSHRNFTLDGLSLFDPHYESVDERKRGSRWSIVLQAKNDLQQLMKLKLPNQESRKHWLRENRSVIKHQSMACLIIGKELVALTTIDRDEDLLSLIPPRIVVRIEGVASISRALLKLKVADSIKLVQLNAAIFAYQFVLEALKESRMVPFSQELLYWTDRCQPQDASSMPTKIMESIRSNSGCNLQHILQTVKPIILDKSQSNSLLMGLSQRVSLIQGPPGTGKSFIGALLAKALHDYAGSTILVVCYTNHALDQFLEDLMDIGIPSSNMIRLGGKSTDRTKSLSLQHILRTSPPANRTKDDWKQIDTIRARVQKHHASLKHAAERYKSSTLGYEEIMRFLEFDDPEYFAAFSLPTMPDGSTFIGKKGKPLASTYLLNQWAMGWDAGALQADQLIQDFAHIWKSNPVDRKVKLAGWEEAILKEQVEIIQELAQEHDLVQGELEAKYDERDGIVMASKKIIGCTTTAAAKYRTQIQAAKPDVLLVEEAGEILESHVLTALPSSVKQMILIGDHQQLRPKVNNYLLTVEKGEGYDLNRSLFERLVIKGYPHETLSQQHRMRPEISMLVRQLTYPDLVDADTTKTRENIRGLRNNVVFIDHDKPEDDLLEAAHLASQSDETSSKSSKSNKYEVEMVLKILRYLVQQGYRTKQMVILTPYLGQLRALQIALKRDNDPILNDLDYGDLNRAGLATSTSTGANKSTIRLATIDNYQGEESDIVIVSLTRSNQDHKIGFMSSPERVNVLLSRARNGLIMIGNANTFRGAKAGNWSQLLVLLKGQGNFYSGLPVKCERHPDRTAILESPDDFDQKSPDGGCSQPCGTMMKCGIHTCSLKCHQSKDHNGIQCQQLMTSPCPKGHQSRFKCHNGPPDQCVKCAHELKLAVKKKKAEFQAQQDRDREQRRHEEKMAEVDAQIAKENEDLRNAQLAEERERALQVRRRDLQNAISSRLMAKQASTSTVPTIPLLHHQGTSLHPSSPPSVQPTLCSKFNESISSTSQDTTASATPTQNPSQSPSVSSGGTSAATTPPKMRKPSAAETEWMRQKQVDGEKNDAIDDIMQMGGLEKVKQEILDIKAKVDVSYRQGVTLSRERFSASMLGNPGTGKTTVARLYGQFLASMRVIQGTTFEETTGSRLANDGVNGAQKIIDKLVSAGGGTFFIDEAYQLTAAHNPEGKKVLDFLLAEIENQVGKIVFLFAGYSREMEKFFEHNPGLTSRVPFTLQFDDYTDEILMDILEGMVTKKFSGRMKFNEPDGLRGLYGRIAVRRLGRGRGQPGFGNARALENLFGRIHQRQTKRIEEQRRNGTPCDPLVLSPADLVGPDPSTVMVESVAWKKLQEMIGLKSVKDSIASFFKLIKLNYERELRELEPQQVSLNRVFLGNPGTGKTTVAKLYGRILADLGLLSNGEVVVKNPADFIGAYIGQSESQTKAILASTVGKVLVIDEAYMLAPGKDGGNADSFKTAVIDTIVAEIQSVPGEDRCVLLLGYREQMEAMFQNANPGLARRFAIENAFNFEDYDDKDLMEALELKLKVQQLSATDAAKQVAIEMLSRARNRPNFGNIGEVENMLSSAKIAYQRRTTSPDAPFEAEDFDPNYRRSENAAENLTALFKDVIGCEEVVIKLRNYQKIAQTCKAQVGLDIRDMIPTTFVFKGPPGTGKTTTARKMGQVFYDMGFLSSNEVIEKSASDMVGQYVGHTGPKTKKLLEQARGRVLFIDEAYRLGHGQFAKEAVDELVTALTLDQYRGKIVVILAGYDQEINDMLAVNPGLSSRFTEEIIFTNMTTAQSIELLDKQLSKKRVTSDILKDPQSPGYHRIAELLELLAELPSWGNARDILELAKQMSNEAYLTQTSTAQQTPLQLPSNEAIACITRFLNRRRERAANLPAKKRTSNQSQTASLGPQSAPPPPGAATSHRSNAAPPPKQEPTRDKNEGRDVGVSDATWEQLQRDRQAQEVTKKQAEEELKAAEEAARREMKREKEVLEALQKIFAEIQAARDEQELREFERLQEQMRKKEAAAKAMRLSRERVLAAKRKEETKRRREEEKAQTKLRQLGVCGQGYPWIKQTHGYRCAGGSHFISNTCLDI